MAVINSKVQKARAFVTVSHFLLTNKHNGYLCFGINYGRNKFYDQSPKLDEGVGATILVPIPYP